MIDNKKTAFNSGFFIFDICLNYLFKKAVKLAFILLFPYISMFAIPKGKK